MNAINIPKDDEIRNEWIQFNVLFLNVIVVIVVNMMNEKMLIQNFTSSRKSNVFLAMMNCMKHVVNCTQRLVKAAPCALNFGMKMKFKIKFVITPIAATKFSCLKLPFDCITGCLLRSTVYLLRYFQKLYAGIPDFPGCCGNR